jgi:hypothetical protein
LHYVPDFYAFINLLIVVNIIILIAMFILSLKGKEYINNAKNNILMKIILKIFVPPVSSAVSFPGNNFLSKFL